MKIIDDAKLASYIAEHISNFEPDDIDSDTVEIRFRIYGTDAGLDISIVKQFGKTSEVINKILDHIDDQSERIAELEKELAALRDNVGKYRNEYMELYSLARGVAGDEVIEAIKAAGGGVEDE